VASGDWSEPSGDRSAAARNTSASRTSRAPQPVARLVDRNLNQPRPQRRVRAETAERRVRLHEHILRHLLGLGSRARDQKRGPEHRVAVALNYHLIRRHVSMPHALDQHTVGALAQIQRPDHHHS
jgi:hypothetical protein